jgi:hypothetical protein
MSINCSASQDQKERAILIAAVATAESGRAAARVRGRNMADILLKASLAKEPS